MSDASPAENGGLSRMEKRSASPGGESHPPEPPPPLALMTCDDDGAVLQ